LPFAPRGGGSVLDIGCGDGGFLSRARDAGWVVAGADPDPQAVENAKQLGLDVRLGGIDCFNEPSAFEVITLNHVIEHVHRPVDTLMKAYFLLKPGGQLYVETPNASAFGHRLFKANWRGLEVPRHLTVFSWYALEDILKQSGFCDLERVVRADIFPGLSAQSRAIRDGKDPHADASWGFVDVVGGVVARVRCWLNYEESEFITIVGHKRLN